MDRPELVKTSHLYNFLSALFAFIVWGSWAYYANSSHGGAVQRVAMMTQGTASFVITLVMTRSVTFLFSRVKDGWPRIFVPSVVTVSITGTALVSVHYWAGTPEVAATVSPALSVAFFYCLYTTYKLRQKAIELHGEQI